MSFFMGMLFGGLAVLIIMSGIYVSGQEEKEEEKYRGK